VKHYKILDYMWTQLSQHWCHKNFIETKQDSFEEYVVKATELCDTTMYESETKRKVNVRLASLESVQAPDVELSP